MRENESESVRERQELHLQGVLCLVRRGSEGKEEVVTRRFKWF